MAYDRAFRTTALWMVASTTIAIGACGDDDTSADPDAASRDATAMIDLGTRPDLGPSAPDAAPDAREGDATPGDASESDANAEDATADDANVEDASTEDASRHDAGVRECDLIACFRPYECVTRCGEEPFYVGCCECPEGSIDAFVDCRPDSGPPVGPGEACGAGRGECTTAYSCCYPCGIPGCENICEPTCDEGTPACAGGCLLRP